MSAPKWAPIPGWRGDWQCQDADHSGQILKRCADCGKIKEGPK